MAKEITAKAATAQLLVGYRLRALADISAFMPAYEAPSTTKDPEKRAAYVADKQAAFAGKAATMPYTATFDEVYISSPRTKEVNRWVWSAERGAGKEKPPICLSVAAWIGKRYPGAWSADVIRRGEPEAIFVGFEPRLFLKVLGLECSLPQHARPLPLGMWYDNTDHRDIGKAIMPSECEKDLALPAVLQARGIQVKEGWPGPCHDPVEDVRITMEIATQLGMVVS